MNITDLLAAGLGLGLILLAGPDATRIKDQFKKGRTSLRARRARRMERKQRARVAELEARRLEAEAARPTPVEPICGCGHDLAFHDVQANVCHDSVGGSECRCQHYTGPEPLAQFYLPPLSDLALGRLEDREESTGR